MSLYVGTDVGGTFTDLVVLSDAGDFNTFKVSTTPDDRSRGVVDALKLAAEGLSVSPDELAAELAYFAHGTTAATNAFLERKGSPTALLTTMGFRDILRLQRAMASWAGAPFEEISHYSARTTPPPIVPLELVGEIDERIDYAGNVIAPLNEERARVLIRRLVASGAQSIAIALLWSFRNPSHEERLAELVTEEAPDIFVSRSSELIPILGEYERTSTTTINAYLGPVIEQYFVRLDDSLRNLSYQGECSIMDSGGGVLPASEASQHAVGLLTSGPAAGVLASARLGEQLGIPNIVTTDMGGTSFDVGLIVGGEPVVDSERIVGRFHVALPAIRVVAIGAGGGSIAKVEDGHLTVGPQSAGALPGPACYQLGGTLPTVTDADVVLGIIDPEYFLGGRMTLDRTLSEQAISKHVAGPLGMTAVEAAAGIREVADNHMADVLRSVTLRMGIDPRDFVAFAFGGAGPTHVYRYAAEAGISDVIIPATATVHSAYGCLISDRHRSFSLAMGQHAPAGFERASDHVDVAVMNDGFASLEEHCCKALSDDADLRRFVGMRFRMQTHEMGVPVPGGRLAAEDLDSLVDAFEKIYEQIFGEGTALRGSGVEFTAMRVEARLPVLGTRLRPQAQQGGDVRIKGRRRVFFYEEATEADVPIYLGESLPAATTLIGPAIIEYTGTTVVVGPNQSAHRDVGGNLRLDLGLASTERTQA